MDAAATRGKTLMLLKFAIILEVQNNMQPLSPLRCSAVRREALFYPRTIHVHPRWQPWGGGWDARILRLFSIISGNDQRCSSTKKEIPAWTNDLPARLRVRAVNGSLDRSGSCRHSRTRVFSRHYAFRCRTS